MWQNVDIDKSGELDRKEAKVFFGQVYDEWYGKKSKYANPETKELKVESWITEFDADQSGTISWEEFIKAMTTIMTAK